MFNNIFILPSKLGGDGAHGLKGNDALQSESRALYEHCWMRQWGTGWGLANVKGLRSEYTCQQKCWQHDRDYFCRAPGSQGTPGSDAGRGGVGGDGGNAGNHMIITNKLLRLTTGNDAKSNIYIEFHSNNSERIVNAKGSTSANATYFSSQYFRGPDGQNGIPGIPGIGGLTGDAEVTKRHDAAIAGDSLGPMPSEPSSERARQGTVYYDSNKNGKLKANKVNQIAYYKLETEYFKYLAEINSKFKNSRILDREFHKWLLTMSIEIWSNTLHPEIFKPEFVDLIERFKLCNSVEYQHMLAFFKSETQHYYGKMTTNSSEKLVLNYTLATIQSTIYHHRHSNQKALVVDVKKFLVLIKENLISDWTTLAKSNLREFYKKNYDENLKVKIDEAMQVVYILRKDIDENEKEINKDFVRIIAELSRFKKDSRQTDKKLLEKKDELQKLSMKNILRKNVIKALSIACQALAFLGPKGQLIGAVGGAALDLTSQFLDKTKPSAKNADNQLNKVVSQYETFLKKAKDTEQANVAQQSGDNKNKAKTEISKSIIR